MCLISQEKPGVSRLQLEWALWDLTITNCDGLRRDCAHLNYGGSSGGEKDLYLGEEIHWVICSRGPLGAEARHAATQEP